MMLIVEPRMVIIFSRFHPHSFIHRPSFCLKQHLLRAFSRIANRQSSTLCEPQYARMLKVQGMCCLQSHYYAWTLLDVTGLSSRWAISLWLLWTRFFKLLLLVVSLVVSKKPWTASDVYLHTHTHHEHSWDRYSTTSCCMGIIHSWKFSPGVLIIFC